MFGWKRSIAYLLLIYRRYCVAVNTQSKMLRLAVQSKFCHSAAAPTGGCVQQQIYVTEITRGKEIVD